MDLDYFVEKFSAIPDEYIGFTKDNLDAWEWCDEIEQEELHRIVKPFGILMEVNDGEEGYDEKFGATPRTRVLNFLEYIRANRCPYLRYGG